MKALQALNYQATSHKLAKYIADLIGQREADIKDTVKSVLSNAVANGFLVTRGATYQLPAAQFTIQTDSRKGPNSRRKQTGRVTKSKAARKSSKATPKTRPAMTRKVNKSKPKKSKK